MPATFLLILLVVVLALSAPLLAASSAALAITTRWRHLGCQLFLYGVVVGGTFLLGWLALAFCFSAVEALDWQTISAAFCAGYTIGSVARALWFIIMRKRPNNSFKPNPLRGSA